jgi:serralysin
MDLQSLEFQAVSHGLTAQVAGVTLNGTAGNDGITGGAGNDVLNGLDGNDLLEGGAGADALNGGAGIDTVSYEHASSSVFVILDNSGTNPNGNGGGDAHGDTYTGIENIRGSNFIDAIFGDGGDNVLEGGGGGDELCGGAGNDTASYDHATTGVVANLADTSHNTGDAAGDIYLSIENLLGSTHNDTLTGNAGDNVLEGGLGADVLVGGGGEDTASYEHASSAVLVNLLNTSLDTGEAQGDTFSGIEDIRGSRFADVLIGDQSHNVIEGGAGSDTIISNGGEDTASYAHSSAGVSVNLATATAHGGDAEGDTLNGISDLRGSAFVDTLTGDANNNVLEGGAGADALNGGAGIDTVSYEHASSTVIVVLDNSGNPNDNGGGDAFGDTYTGIENVRGSNFVDVIFADGGDNVLEGGGGGDELCGGAGSDTASYEHAATGVVANLADTSHNTGDAAGDIYLSIESLLGSSHDDTLTGDANNNAINGGAGNDTLTGGAGNDTFVFRAALGHDTINDFVSGQDVIELHDGLFANANAALAAAHQVGADVVITVDANDNITLHNFALANLHASDFHIV